MKDDQHFWTYPRNLRDQVLGFDDKNKIKRDEREGLKDMASEKVTQEVPT